MTALPSGGLVEMIGFDRRGRLMHESRQIRPSEEVEAKKAEIARRYTRERRPFSQLERILSLRRSQLIRLFKYRDGLHDDEAGRADLRLLLDLGLSGPEAMMVAPWISPGELQHLIDDSNAHPQFWKPDALGNHVELTFEEKVALDIRNINCFDRPKRQVTAFYERRRRERGPDGRPRDPWQNTRFCYLIDPITQEAFTFTTSSWGGRGAVIDLADQIQRKRFFRAGAVPVVELHSAPTSRRSGS
jgi:hypothetical protein